MDQYATYCPEDNKLRLYIGRVPRDEYLKLRDEGWKALHKQREAGGGDFVATWTPSRRDTALEYGGGIILDEDMGPAERAADRAERFSGYRDKRTTEAVGHADNYDSQPSAHGFQSAAKAERAAQRHDRIADRACDSWSKAEYWQSRTEGVIRHALYKSEPGVRMGRIKELEKLLRKHNADVEKYRQRYANWQKIAAMEDPQKQTEAALKYCGFSDSGWSEYKHPRAVELPDGDYYKDKDDASLYSLLTHKTHPITGKEACDLYFSDHGEPKEDDSWSLHYKLRLAYEQQMLAAQGGMLEQCEIQVGGKLGGHLIIKVNKSQATGRVTSVSILGEKVGSGWHYKCHNIPGTEWAEHQMDTERIEPGEYTAPTPESLAELEKVKAAIKAGAPKTETISLINPTMDDARKLQAIWNEQNKKRYAHYTWHEHKDAEVLAITQAQYSQSSGGTYSPFATVIIDEFGCEFERSRKGSGSRCQIFKIRKRNGANYGADRVVVLTDKPQKPIPFKGIEAARAALPTIESMRPKLPQIAAEVRKPWNQEKDMKLLSDADYVGWVDVDRNDPGFTEAGAAALKAFEAEEQQRHEERIVRGRAYELADQKLHPENYPTEESKRSPCGDYCEANGISVQSELVLA